VKQLLEDVTFIDLALAIVLVVRLVGLVVLGLNSKDASTPLPLFVGLSAGALIARWT